MEGGVAQRKKHMGLGNFWGKGGELNMRVFHQTAPPSPPQHSDNSIPPVPLPGRGGFFPGEEVDNKPKSHFLAVFVLGSAAKPRTLLDRRTAQRFFQLLKKKKKKNVKAAEAVLNSETDGVWTKIGSDFLRQNASAARPLVDSHSLDLLVK